MKLSIVGCGYVSYYYYVSMKNYDDLFLQGVYDRNKDKRNKLAKHCNCKSYNTLDELLEDSEVDIVLNLTTPKSHYEINKKVLKHKKNLFCEKPITLRLEELEELINISEKNNLKIISAPCVYLSNYANKLKELLTLNSIGRVYKIESKLEDTFENFQRYGTFLNHMGAKWPLKDELTIGCNLEHNGYMLSLITYLFGNISSIKRINSKYSEESLTTPDYYYSILDINHDIEFHLTSSTCSNDTTRSTIIYGEKGEIILENIWDFKSKIYIKDEKNKRNIVYEPENFRQDWNLYIDLIRPILYFKEGKSIMETDQILHILEIMINIQENKLGKITNKFSSSPIEKYHFYINLEKRSKRNKHCRKQLQSIGIIRPNRFNAIENKIGLIGCAESHIKCIEIAKESGWPFVCIFEDDVLFLNTKHVNDKIKKYINYDYDVLYIGAWLRNNKYENIFDDLIKVDYTNCLHAYIVKNHYYDILLTNLKEGVRLKKINPENYHYNNDEYIKQLQERDKWLCLSPIMATQINGFSDNFNEIRNYEKIIPIIPNKVYPKVSILTPTYNRKIFLPLMIHNIENFDYPSGKIEWVILDSYSKENKRGVRLFNSKREIEDIEKKLDIKINYTYFKKKMEIGEKRNWLAEKASNDILINMDDDDLYVPSYLNHSVDILMNNDKDITGCLDMLFIYPRKDYQVSYIHCGHDFRLYDEATMCMKKDHWNKYKYEELSKGEGENIYGNVVKCGLSDIIKCMICVCWEGNTVNKDIFLKNRINMIIKGDSLNILKNIFEEDNRMEENTENTENTIQIPKELLQNIRNLIEVTNDRIKWKTEELLPVGLMIKQINELLKHE